MSPDSDLFEIRSGKYGYGVFAKTLIPELTIVGRLHGPTVTLEQSPASELNYLVRLNREQYFIPSAPERFINHSCSPNCVIDDDFNVVAIRSIQPEEQVTFSYNRVTADELEQWGSFWHPAWTFDCLCQTSTCLGRIDRYHVET